MKTTVGFTTFCGRICLVLCLLVVVAQPAFSYDDPPIRVARLNYVEGRVSFQPGGESDWAWATLNRPMTAGDSLWTGNGSRAEMHIGSTAIRVGGQTSVSFLNLDDRTVQIQLNSGTINVRVRNLYRGDVFEVDTPNLAFTVLRSGDYRITVDPQGSFTTITLRDGQGQVNGGGQAFLVDGRSQVQVSGTDYISYDIYNLPGRDSFDQWSYTRQLREERSRSARYVSPELTGYEDLDRNGTWRTDRTYGPVWVPTRVSRDWAPYRDGHWAWVEPWGWTWVDDSPSGFVTSHYGRWAHTNSVYGAGGGWVWVPPRRETRQDVPAQRPVYSPALVTFVGDSNSSRDFGNGGGVAWVPLAPGEVYVPAHQTSPTYVTNVNVTNTVVKQTTITNVVNNVVNNNVQTTTYINQNVAGAVTAVPQATFVNAQPVARAAVRVAPSAITTAPAVRTAPVAPVRASVMGANRANAASAAAVSAPPKPPDAVVIRPVVAKVAPPPPPVAFAQKQQALQANPGKPLDTKTEQNLRAATPPPLARVVRTAPVAATVKPVETAAKKPQPATSPNTAQQVHPPSPGAPPAATGSQGTPQQQLAEEKAKQQAAQQQAAQQTVAAEKAKQEAAQQQASADKAKQEAARQQAAQLATAEKAKQDAAQQQASADKAKQEAARQQSAAEKSKQDATQQHAAQLAAAEKVKQEAAQQQASADKAKQEAARQQAAQLATAEKAKQDAAQQQASADKAKQEAARQQAAQLATAEKAKQDAAQQHAAQLAAAEKVKQEAAQQQASADKAKQEAARQQADQQAAAERAKQQAAQVRAVAEKTRQDAAQQQADRPRHQPPPDERPQSDPNARPPRGAPPANSPAAANNGPVRVAENVQAAKLVSQPKLNYPPAAQAAHIQGTVRVQALIGADGRVKNATVLSGPQPLHAAALENARQRQYKPTMVDGKPVEVETEISIQF
jgi:TonB family protein